MRKNLWKCFFFSLGKPFFGPLSRREGRTPARRWESCRRSARRPRAPSGTPRFCNSGDLSLWMMSLMLMCKIKHISDFTTNLVSIFYCIIQRVNPLCCARVRARRRLRASRPPGTLASCDDFPPTLKLLNIYFQYFSISVRKCPLTRAKISEKGKRVPELQIGLCEGEDESSLGD